MPSGVQKTTDIPESEVENVVAGFRLDNPTKIEKIRQPDGRWTVVATFLDPDSIQAGDTGEILRSQPARPASHTGTARASRILGKLSEKYETGGRGPGTVSSGVGDPGGASYGSYQMTSRNGGTVARFIAQPEFPWRDEFQGLEPGSAEFTAKWKEIASTHPEEFQETQHAYIKKTFFDALVAKIKTEDDLDVTSRSHTVQDVIWSTAVQHGANTLVVHRALETLRGGGTLDLDDSEFDRKLIEAIYAERSRKNAQGKLVYFTRSSDAMQEGVARRFVEEKRDALQMLENE
jgi:hypothetical protein